jgi:hypothetical protein
MSMDKSRKDSSREDTCEHVVSYCQKTVIIGARTVSQVKHRVSLVSIPSNNLCTRVASCGEVPELELVVPVTTVGENVPIEADTAQ